MIRNIAWGALALGLAFAPRAAAAAHHEPVIQVVTVEVAAGQMEAYKAELKKLAAVIARIDATARLRAWEATAAGEDTGTVLVGVEYANEAAWADDSAKTQSDPEWNKIVAGLAGMRTVVSTSIWRDVSPSPAAADATGGVLVLTGVEILPGKYEAYRTLVGNGRAISDGLGLKSQLRMWRAEIAGPNTGSVAVGVTYPDLATYVADRAKLSADAGWTKLMADLEGVRTVRTRALYREITP
jgi:hypothetical protein